MKYLLVMVFMWRMPLGDVQVTYGDGDSVFESATLVNAFHEYTVVYAAPTREKIGAYGTMAIGAAKADSVSYRLYHITTNGLEAILVRVDTL